MFREQLAQSPISHFTRASINPSRSWNCKNRHEASSDAHQPRQPTINSTYTNSTYTNLPTEPIEKHFDTTATMCYQNEISEIREMLGQSRHEEHRVSTQNIYEGRRLKKQQQTQGENLVWWKAPPEPQGPGQGVYNDIRYPVTEARMRGNVMASGANPDAGRIRRVPTTPPHHGHQFGNLISPAEASEAQHASKGIPGTPWAQHGIGSVDGQVKTKEASLKRKSRVSKVGKKLLGWIGIRRKDSHESFVCARARMEERDIHHFSPVEAEMVPCSWVNLEMIDSVSDFDICHCLDDLTTF
ncbi:hypothetical protein AUP68_12296 [Ilyonectria robusta]